MTVAAPVWSRKLPLGSTAMSCELCGRALPTRPRPWHSRWRRGPCPGRGRDGPALFPWDCLRRRCGTGRRGRTGRRRGSGNCMPISGGESSVSMEKGYGGGAVRTEHAASAALRAARLLQVEVLLLCARFEFDRGVVSLRVHGDDVRRLHQPSCLPAFCAASRRFISSLVEAKLTFLTAITLATFGPGGSPVTV